MIRFLSEIKGDFISCWNFAKQIYDNPPIEKRLAIVGLALIFIIQVFTASNESGIYLYFARVLFVCIITFLVLTWSNTYWFLRKKAWSFKLVANNRKCIQDTIKKINKLKVEKEKNPIGAIYITAYNDLVGYKPHLRRIEVEIIILLAILFFTFPPFFIFNLALFCMMFFYVAFYEGQVSTYVWQDIMTLTNSIKSLYDDNPENCRKFILENDSLYVRELGNIYRTIRNSV